MTALQFILQALESLSPSNMDRINESNYDNAIDPTSLYYSDTEELENDKYSIECVYDKFPNRNDYSYIFIFKVYNKIEDDYQYVRITGYGSGFCDTVWYPPEFIEFDRRIMDISAGELAVRVVQSFEESGFVETELTTWDRDRLSSFLRNPDNGDIFRNIFRRTVTNNQSYKVTYEDTYGGEGMGDEYWVVYGILDKVTEIKRYVKFEGTYNSWSDTYWETPYYVVPEQVMTTIYRKV